MRLNLKSLLLAAAILLCYAAQPQQESLYTFEKKIALPGNSGYDYISIDSVNRHLFVSHGTSVNVIDLATEQPLAIIDNMKGVHGIAVVNEVNKGFITDGRNNAIVVFDLLTFKIIKTIMLTGKGPDGIIYDPFSRKVLAFCGDSNSACIINVDGLSEDGTIDLGGAPEFAVSDGNGLVYNNLEDKNSIAVIDTKAMKVIHTYPASPCGKPTGITLDKEHQRLFTVCRDNKGMTVLNSKTGQVVTTVAIGAGVDAVIYDAASRLIFCSNGDGTTTVIRQASADSYSVVQTLTTRPRAKTMAFDKMTRKIYLSANMFETGTKNIIPDSFSVLVFAPLPGQ